MASIGPSNPCPNSSRAVVVGCEILIGVDVGVHDRAELEAAVSGRDVHEHLRDRWIDHAVGGQREVADTDAVPPMMRPATVNVANREEKRIAFMPGATENPSARFTPIMSG